MQEPLLYEYAVIRVVPRVERAEFINAGVVLYCKKTNQLLCKTKLHKEKVLCLSPKTDIVQLENNLNAFEKIGLGDKDCHSPIAKLDAASRFRWLSATRSTMIQCSKVHPGYAVNLQETIMRLMNDLVY